MMKSTTPFSTRFGLKGPLMVAPMAGGPTGPELVAACSNAGALGSLAGAYLNPEELARAIEKTQSLTHRPFAVNLFVGGPQLQLSSQEIDAALQATRKYRAELGLADPVVKPPFHPDFDQQFEVVLKSKPAAFSFVFGALEQKYLKECKRLGIYTIGTATTLNEALVLQESRVDAVVAQSVESGGHHGMFHPDDRSPMLGTLALTRVLAAKLRIPVISAGGIMDGKGIAATLALGAQAASLGTAFLACDEAGTSKPYREALLDPRRPVSRLTRVFSGRWARGLENRFMREMEEQAILPFPAQNAFTRDLRNQSAKNGKADLLSLWAGAGVSLIRKGPAAELIEKLFAEAEAALA